MKVARQFIAGNIRKKRMRPSGALERISRGNFRRPDGLAPSRAQVPGDISPGDFHKSPPALLSLKTPFCRGLLRVPAFPQKTFMFFIPLMSSCWNARPLGEAV